MTVDLTTGAAAPRTANIRAATGYRRDIDGMRGLAVLSVLLFHISPDFAPKGFLGVDIFFVISGFVITKLLVETRVDVLTFYTRRVNRLCIAPGF